MGSLCLRAIAIAMVRGRLLLLGRPAGAPGCWMVGPRTDAAGVPVLAVLDMAPFLVIALAGLLLRVGSSRRDLDGGRGGGGEAQPQGGTSGQALVEWCSLMHCLHLSEGLAFPKKASLYICCSSTAQLRLRPVKKS